MPKLRKTAIRYLQADGPTFVTKNHLYKFSIMANSAKGCVQSDKWNSDTNTYS